MEERLPTTEGAQGKKEGPCKEKKHPEERKRKELMAIDKDAYKCPETGQGEVCCAEEGAGHHSRQIHLV
jgi:hypothetical protein